MSGTVLWGAAAGAAFASGLVLLALAWGARRPSLARRVAPYLGTRSAGAAPSSAPARLLAPLLADGARALERWTSSTPDVARRLLHAGRAADVPAFRTEQMVWAAVGTSAGLALALAVVLVRQASPVLGLVLVLVGGAVGALARDYALTIEARRRAKALGEDLATVAELLALAVTAGEGAVGAVSRVATRARGPLADELAEVTAEVRDGQPLTEALDRMGTRTGVAAVQRMAEAVAVAVDRGTPLAEVLHAQAQDARESGRRALMEAAGRKEVAMLVPVVLLILPVTVAFAVFPGLAALRLDL